MKFAWHIHHDQLVEPLTEPISKRRAYIKEYKPKHERPTRLRLLKVVRGKLPQPVLTAGAAYDKAWAAYDKAWAAYHKAWAAYDKARAAYDKAWAACDKAGTACDKAGAAYDKALAACDKAGAAYAPAIEALHAQECPNCPWDGRTIFPAGGAKAG
jgi:tetratricopeptide (TPR) repeat protein